MSFNLPNPCLLAILLTVSTHNGPQFVFHYPPVPETFDYEAAAPLTSTQLDSGSEYSSDSESDDDLLSEFSDDDNSGEGPDSRLKPKSHHVHHSNSNSHHVGSASSTTIENRGGMTSAAINLTSSTAAETDAVNNTSRSPIFKSLESKLSSSYSVTSPESSRVRTRSNTLSDSPLAPIPSNSNSSVPGSVLSPSTSTNPSRRNTRDHVSSRSSPSTHIPKSDAHSGLTGTGNTGGWEKVLGFDTDFLSELLCPQRDMCNTRFEMTVDDMAFLGLPIHILSDGTWAKKRQKDPNIRSMRSTVVNSTGTRHNSSSNKDIPGPSNYNLESSIATLTGGEDNGEEADDEMGGLPHETFHDRDQLYESPTEYYDGDDDADDHFMGSTGHDSKSKRNISTSGREYTDPNSPMRSFHVVFVMNPPVIEYAFRIEEMYRYVLSKFVQSLRRENARSNYVWKEVSTLLKLRDTAADEGKNVHELWEDMSTHSSLAVAIAQLYNAIVASDIANVVINSRIRSFQIPVQNQFYSLPGITEPVVEGSYLTTSWGLEDQTDFGDKDSLAPHFALLLLDEPENIIHDIQTDAFDALNSFIRGLNPTESIYQLGTVSGIPLPRLIEFSRNLIYWRRARAIPPLNHRNIYIVSPLAPMADLYQLIPVFKKAFPSLPSLPRILSMLSTGKPRPFTNIIPSRDHRDVYLEALAWLMRYGLVTQLKTFLWLKISKRIKLSVHRQIQLEEELRESSKLAEETGERRILKNTDTTTDNTSKGVAVPSSSSDGAGNLQSFSSLSTNASPVKGNSIDGEDVSRGLESSNTEDLLDDTIILEPDRATALERKWIAKIIENKPVEIANMFAKLHKHFNGRQAMESVLMSENLSRQDLRKLTNALEENILMVRHW